MAPLAVVCATVVDCQDPARLAAFWKRLLGGLIISYPQLGVESLRAPGIAFDFVRNPDPKVVKNRWHLDLATDDAEATVTEALVAGATPAVDFEETEDFVVMRDPEGNEFCVLRHAPATGHGTWFGRARTLRCRGGAGGEDRQDACADSTPS